MAYSLRSASNYTTAELATLFNRGFEDYFIPISFMPDAFEIFLKRDEIDLTLSRVLLKDDEPIGLGLMSSRGGNVSRLAAMGIAKELRGQGAGTWLVDALLKEARARGYEKMLLEVIYENEAAIHIYEKFGFKKLRRLYGFMVGNPAGEPDKGLASCDLDLVLEKAMTSAIPNLPWQVDAETLRKNPAGAFGFTLGKSYIVISDPEKEHAGIRLLVSEDGSEEALLKAIFAKYPEKIWHVPAIFPEEQADIFESVGMQKDDISQWQMMLEL
mgnify:CR=1 FL=1